MSIKHIPILTLLICQLGTQNFIQAEFIHGVDVPTLDGSKIIGKWYELTSYDVDDALTCTINIIEQLSEDHYRMNTTMTLSPEAKERLSPMYNPVMEYSDLLTLRHDSAILVRRNDDAVPWMAVVFDIDYDSYLVMYVTSENEITDSTLGLIYIFGREKELPPGIIEKTEQSNFYKYGMHPNFKLHPVNPYGCIE